MKGRGQFIYFLRQLFLSVYSRYSTLYMQVWLLVWGIESGKNNLFFGFTRFVKYPGSRISIGNNCRFRSDKYSSNLAGITSNCLISTTCKDAHIFIGNNCGFSGSTISADNSIIIEDDVLIGANSRIFDNDFHTDTTKPIRIRRGVWLGLNVIVLKGVTIGEGTIIGANSVVTKDIPANCIAAGNPCKVIKQK